MIRRLGSALLCCAVLLAQSGSAVAADPPAEVPAFPRNNGDTTEAQLWRIVESDPDNPGAWLDLGIVYCQNGFPLAAERIFRLIEDRYAPPEGIRQLLDHYRHNGCRRQEQASPPGGKMLLRVHAGTDSNPNQGLAAGRISLQFNGLPVELDLARESLPRRDNWVGMDLAATPEMLPDIWQVFGYAGIRHYREQTDFDTAQFVAGLGRQESDRALRIWGSLLTLGGNLYHTQIGALVQVRPDNWHGTGYEITASIQDFPRRPEQRSMTFEPRLTWTFGDARTLGATLAAGYQVDHALHDRPGGRRQGPLVQGELRTLLPAGWRFEGWLRAQWPHERDAYSPLFGDERRRSREWLAGMGVGYPLTRDTRVVVQLQHRHAEDNIPLFSFRQTQAWLTWEHLLD